MSSKETIFPTSSNNNSHTNNACSKNAIVEHNGTWWKRFTNTLNYLSPTALTVLQQDAEWIAEQVSPEGENISQQNWPTSRVRTGITVGSVQSGKTANMLGVSALLLDRKVTMLVILCGTQISLWLQTFERLLEQLDQSSPSTAYKKNSQRILVPNPEDVINENARLNPKQYITALTRKMKRATINDQPIIAVIPKHDAHLSSLSKAIKESVKFHNDHHSEKPFHLVVLDDEADDSSILDTAQEKMIPKYIQDLWSNTTDRSQTFSLSLYASYIAYTATPHANFLQKSHNPLSPRNFAACLRVPGITGNITKREVTYEDPLGVSSYYIGGWPFYGTELTPNTNLCITHRNNEHKNLTTSRSEILGEAIRSFFVAGALRLLSSNKDYSSLSNLEPLPLEQLKQIIPAPHSMLFHPSNEISDHFEGANEIIQWAINSGEKINFSTSSNEYSKKITEGLSRRLKTEEALWEQWFNAYKNTVKQLREFPRSHFPFFKNEITWDLVKQTMLSELFPFIKIKVLNSDTRASSRPSFSPNLVKKGSQYLYLPPKDLLTIFVAGNVLSRGVTLEGLTTSIFLRQTREPAADTQMQMQRWFGYRGSFLPLCRVFLYQDQFHKFKQYHYADHAMKQQILHSMDNKKSFSDSNVQILHGEDFLATKKVSSSRLPLHPGPAPSIKIIEDSDKELMDHNMNILNSLLNNGAWQELYTSKNKSRGLIRTEPLSIDEVASTLESFLYTKHSPTHSNKYYKRWSSLNEQLDIKTPFLRLPENNEELILGHYNSCPYSIAAYLRFWKTLTTYPEAKSFYLTNNSENFWHRTPLSQHQKNLPTFYVAVRYGSGELCSKIQMHKIPCMKRDKRVPGLLKTLWGTRGREESYFGDEYIDYHFHHTQPTPKLHNAPKWRPVGHPGLILFHIIKDNFGNEIVTVGLSIPHGGPDQIAALCED